MNSSELVVGVISDTHGIVLPNVHKAFKGVDQIIHAGDIENPDVLLELGLIAPVTAILGNMDHAQSFPNLHEQACLTLGSLTALLIHDYHRLRNIPAHIQLVICGHTHKMLWGSLTDYVQGTSNGNILNPGSASRRSTHPSVAILAIVDSTVQHRFEML